MAASDPSRDLRRLVTQMATFRAEDIAHVLGTVEADDRAAIESLLQDYARIPVSPAAPAEFGRSGLSPWLLDILDRNHSGLTSDARGALAECARVLLPNDVQESSKASSPSLVERFGAGLRARAAR